MSDVSIKLHPSGEIVEVDGNKTLLEGLREKNVYIRSSCGGTGSCGECVIKVVKEKEKSYLSMAEISFLGNVYHITKERMSCQCEAKHFEEIDISAHNKADQQDRMREKNRKLRNS